MHAGVLSAGRLWRRQRSVPAREVPITSAAAPRQGLKGAPLQAARAGRHPPPRQAHVVVCVNVHLHVQPLPDALLMQDQDALDDDHICMGGRAQSCGSHGAQDSGRQRHRRCGESARQPLSHSKQAAWAGQQEGCRPSCRCCMDPHPRASPAASPSCAGAWRNRRWARPLPGQPAACTARAAQAAERERRICSVGPAARQWPGSCLAGLLLVSGAALHLLPPDRAAAPPAGAAAAPPPTAHRPSAGPCTQ